MYLCMASQFEISLKINPIGNNFSNKNYRDQRGHQIVYSSLDPSCIPICSRFSGFKLHMEKMFIPSDFSKKSLGRGSELSSDI